MPVEIIIGNRQTGRTTRALKIAINYLLEHPDVELIYVHPWGASRRFVQEVLLPPLLEELINDPLTQKRVQKQFIFTSELGNEYRKNYAVVIDDSKNATYLDVARAYDFNKDNLVIITCLLHGLVDAPITTTWTSVDKLQCVSLTKGS